MLSGSCSRSRSRSLDTSSRCQLPASSTTRLAFVIGAWLVAARKCVAIGATFGHRKCSGCYVTDRCARYGRRKATSRQSPSVVPKWPKPRQRACRAHSTTNLRQSKTIQANPRHAKPRHANPIEMKRNESYRIRCKSDKRQLKLCRGAAKLQQRIRIRIHNLTDDRD